MVKMGDKIGRDIIRKSFIQLLLRRLSNHCLRFCESELPFCQIDKREVRHAQMRRSQKKEIIRAAYEGEDVECTRLSTN